MQEIIKVDEEVVADIQQKDFAQITSKDIIKQLIDMHTLDTNANFMESPVFQAYQKSAEEKQLVYERAKDKMIKDFIPETMQAKVKSWTLNYATCELTVIL